MRLHARPLTLIVALTAATALLGAVACGSDGASADSSASDQSSSSGTNSGSAVVATEEPDAPGRILLSSSEITGQEGKILLIVDSANTSRICVAIDSDPWSLDKAPLTDIAANSTSPCDGDTADTLFDPGEHIITADVYTSGNPVSQRTAAVAVDIVDGDAHIEIDGSKLSDDAQVGGPGRILVTVSEITGQKGKILVVLAQGNTGSVCAAIDSENWSLPAPTAMTQLPGEDAGPCGQDTPQSTFQPGDQVVIASVFVPGTSESPDTVQTIVTVEGDTTLALDGSALSAD